MPKLEIRGYFHEIGEPTQVGKNNVKQQKIIFMVWGYADRSRDINNPDQPWLLEVFGDYVDKLGLNAKDHTEARAKLTVYIDGYTAKGKDGSPFFGYRVKLTQFELLNVKA